MNNTGHSKLSVGDDIENDTENTEDNPEYIPEYTENSIMFIKRAIDNVTQLVLICQKDISDVTPELVKSFCRVNDKKSVPTEIWKQITAQVKRNMIAEQ